jgi:hypothetical protein
MWAHPAQAIMLFMFNDNLLRPLSRIRSDESRRFTPRPRTIEEPTRQRQSDDAPLIIRHADPVDLPALQRLAALDSRRIPSGELFVAEVSGSLRAAVSIDTGAVIADPFEHTAAIVDLLRLHASAVRTPARRPAAAVASAQAATVN